MRILADTINDVRYWRAIGDNLNDVQQWLANTPPTWSSRTSITAKAEKDWDLGVGYEGALKLAETGWSEGAKDLSDRLATHMPTRDHEDSWRYDVAGELPDIGRFLAGDPMHMRRHGHPKGHQPIISLLVRICCAGATKASAFANYGTALCAIVDQLENMGRRVEVNVTDVSECNGTRVSLGWTVKHAEDSLDLAAIAFSLAHPAASRRIGFAMTERCGARETYSYGRPLKPTAADWIDPLPGMYCIDGVGMVIGLTLDQAIAMVVKQVNDAAGETLVTVEG
jgi:hypothetical protein